MFVSTVIWKAKLSLLVIDLMVPKDESLLSVCPTRYDIRSQNIDTCGAVGTQAEKTPAIGLCSAYLLVIASKMR